MKQIFLFWLSKASTNRRFCLVSEFQGALAWMPWHHIARFDTCELVKASFLSFSSVLSFLPQKTQAKNFWDQGTQQSSIWRVHEEIEELQFPSPHSPYQLISEANLSIHWLRRDHTFRLTSTTGKPPKRGDWTTREHETKSRLPDQKKEKDRQESSFRTQGGIWMREITRALPR